MSHLKVEQEVKMFVITQLLVVNNLVIGVYY